MNKIEIAINPEFTNNEEVDLYDGMIINAMSNRHYFDNLNPDILKETHSKLEHYIDIMSYIDRPDADPSKSLEANGLSKKLGLENKYLVQVITNMKGRIETLMKRAEFKEGDLESHIDFYDGLIKEALKRPGLFNDLDKGDLEIIKVRLEEYYEVMSDEERQVEAEELEDKFGFYFGRGILRDLLGLCEFLVEG